MPLTIYTKNNVLADGKFTVTMLRRQATIYSLKTKTVEWYKHLLKTHKLMQKVLLKDTIL